MQSDREQQKQGSVSITRVLTLLLIGLSIALLLFTQAPGINEYKLYFTEERKPVTLDLSEFSETWTVPYLRERFPGYPIRCFPYQGTLKADTACGVDVEAHNGVPTLYMSFFFAGGRLTEVSINIPWWAHGRGRESVVRRFGEPAAIQLLPVHGVRLEGWQLPDGAALFYNRDRPFNPFSWSAIYWRSAQGCGPHGCFAKSALGQ